MGWRALAWCWPALLPGLGIAADLLPAARPDPAFVFAAEVPVAVRLTLWLPGFKRGRAEPIQHNFMAQLLFSGEAAPVTCALRMADADAELQPGQTLDLAIRCVLPFRVLPGAPEFALSSAGKAIGEGRLRAAALAQVMAGTQTESTRPAAEADSRRGAQNQ